MLLPNAASGTMQMGKGPLHLPSFRLTHRVAIDLLMIIEFLEVIASTAIAHIGLMILSPESPETLQSHLIVGILGSAVVHYVLRKRGLYTIASVHEWRCHFRPLVGAVGLSFLTLFAIAFLLRTPATCSRLWMFGWFGVVLVVLPLGRLLSAYVLNWLASSGHMARRIALVTMRDNSTDMVDYLLRTPGARLVSILKDRQTRLEPDGQPDISELIKLGQCNQIDEVIVDSSSVPTAYVDRLLEAVDVLPVNVWLASDLSRPILRTARLGSYNLLQVRPKPISDWGALSKTAIDYSLGLIALMLFILPMLMVAIAIKLDSHGPVLFRQRRHGYNHRVIDVLKFRTMHVAEDGGCVEQARRNDPRVTRIGKILRRSSIDELPQLFNVLRGEMSLVGPRPHALAHNQFYEERVGRYALRHCVKPGITGWAQINGCRGQTEDLEQMRERVELDLYYIENWSLLFDIRILALTPFLGFINRNAY